MKSTPKIQLLVEIWENYLPRHILRLVSSDCGVLGHYLQLPRHGKQDQTLSVALLCRPGCSSRCGSLLPPLTALPIGLRVVLGGFLQFLPSKYFPSQACLLTSQPVQVFLLLESLLVEVRLFPPWWARFGFRAPQEHSGLSCIIAHILGTFTWFWYSGFLSSSLIGVLLALCWRLRGWRCPLNGYSVFKRTCYSTVHIHI